MNTDAPVVTSPDRRHLGGTGTAIILRKVLREAFPGQKFSVRSDSNSVQIEWTDGPMVSVVNQVTDCLRGGYFDGMTDHAGSTYHEMNGEPVRFASYIFCTRNRSAERTVELAMALRREGFGDEFVLRGGEWPWIEWMNGGYPPRFWEVDASLASPVAPLPSATLATIRRTGDDGYGRGTTGSADRPGGERGYVSPKRGPVDPSKGEFADPESLGKMLAFRRKDSSF